MSEDIGVSQQQPESAQPKPDRVYTHEEMEQIKAHTAARVGASERKKAQKAIEALQVSHLGDESSQTAPFVDVATRSKGLSPDEIQKIVNETVETKARELAAQQLQQFSQQQRDQLLQQLGQKLNQGAVKAKESGIEDYDNVIQSLPWQNGQMDDLAQLANEFENTDKILYELGKDQAVAAQIKDLYRFNPVQAKIRMQNLADSIKANEKGSNFKQPNPPLQQIRPSVVKTAGDVSLEDGTTDDFYRRRAQKLGYIK